MGHELFCHALLLLGLLCLGMLLYWLWSRSRPSTSQADQATFPSLEALSGAHAQALL